MRKEIYEGLDSFIDRIIGWKRARSFSLKQLRERAESILGVSMGYEKADKNELQRRLVKKQEIFLLGRHRAITGTNVILNSKMSTTPWPHGCSLANAW